MDLLCQLSTQVVWDLTIFKGGPEVWAPVLYVVCNGAVMGLSGLLARCPYEGTTGSTLDSRFRKVGVQYI